MESPITAPGDPAASSARRNVAIKGVFSGDYSGARGAFLVVIDPSQQKLDRVHAIIANDKTEDRFRVAGDWKTLEDALVSAKLHGQAIVELSKDVQNYIRKTIQDDAIEPLSEAIQANQQADVRRILVDIISKAIADANVLMQIAVEEFVLEPPSDQSATVVAESAPLESDAAMPAPAVQQARVKVDPILSPVAGIAAKNVAPGMTMVVEVKDGAVGKTALAKALALRQPGAAGKNQYEAKVIDVQPADYDRVAITVSLGPDIVGTTSLSGELRIKVSDASLKLANVRADGKGAVAGGPLPPVSTNIFLWAALGILAIMAVLAYLVFGGIL